MAVATGSCEEEQLTLEQAIKDKYCLEEGEDPSSNVSKDFNETALGHRPGIAASLYRYLAIVVIVH